jgi:aspartyl protease family protein
VIRLLAMTFAATLAMLAMAMHSGTMRRAGTQISTAQPGAESTAINPWSKDAPPPSRWKFVNANSPASATSAARNDNPGSAVIARDSSGHFRITGRVNGQDTEFLVDTGADIVSLTRDEAQRLGIFVSSSDFRPMLRTASGSADAAPVRIDSLTIGGTELRNVDAVVVDGLGTNLLGQSALRRLGKLEQDGDRMAFSPG